MHAAPVRRRPVGWIVVLTAGLLGLGVCLAGSFWAWKTLIGEKPGEGKKAEAGYAACAPVIAALERYQAEKGQYPPDLNALQPDYLDGLPPEADSIGMSYTAAAGSYRLEFSYTGPGMNHCTYQPEAGWDCTGYY